MVLLSCSGTGRGISANLTNEVARHNCARAFATHNSVARHCAVRGFAKRQQQGPRKCPYRHQLPNCRAIRNLSPNPRRSGKLTRCSEPIRCGTEYSRIVYSVRIGPPQPRTVLLQQVPNTLQPSELIRMNAASTACHTGGRGLESVHNPTHNSICLV